MRARLLATAVIAAALMAAGAKAEDSGPRIIGLLVGASDYGADPLGLGDLAGPRNDVLALADVLVERGAKAGDLTILTTRAEMADYRATAALRVAGAPDREAVIAGLMDLIDRARPGDQVVIQLAGHGWRQAERIVGSEPDGFDEVFLPGGYGGGLESLDPKGVAAVPGAILDDEIGVAVDRLRAKGADVIFIGDFCHSGDSTRARPNLDGKARGRKLEVAEAPETLDYGSYTAFFAAPSNGRAMQGRGPIWAPGEERAPYGLLSLYLTTALRDPAMATWSDVAARVQASLLEHDVRDRSVRLDAPAEFEGDLDQPVLGRGAGSSPRWTVLKPAVVPVEGRVALDGLDINAGALHGLSEGSVVALSETRDGADRVVLYGRATEVGPTTARLVPASGPGSDVAAWADLKAPDGRPYSDERLWTATIQARGADFRYRVAVPDGDSLIGEVLAGLDVEDLSVERAMPGGEADLYLHPREDGALVLSESAEANVPGSDLGVIDIAAIRREQGEAAEPYLRQTLADALLRAGRAARVRTVLATLDAGAPGGGQGLEAEYFLWRPRGLAEPGGCPAFDPSHAWLTDSPPADAASFASLGLANGGSPTLKPCDVIFTRVVNTGDEFLDVTPLTFSADAAIWALPWMDGRPAVRFEPGRARMTAVQLDPADPARIPNEELVLIAVQADRQGGAPASFARLAQPGVASREPLQPGELSRSDDTSTPLMALLEEARFGAERSGAVPTAPERVSITRLSWRVETPES